MGDAAGVGPEIIMKSLAHREVYEQCRPLVIGDAERLRQAGRICASGLAVQSCADWRRVGGGTNISPVVVDCMDLKLISSDLPWGRLSTRRAKRPIST